MSRQPLIYAIDIVRQTLACHNANLSRHSDRVAYILLQMLKDCEEYTGREKQNIFLLGLYHDIGAYAQETSRIHSLEIQDAMEHSIFGYLLLRTFSPLSEYADCILYHHNHTAQYYPVPLTQKHRRIARLLYMAGRIDICLMQDGPKAVVPYLANLQRQHLLSDQELQLFQKADEKRQICEHLCAGSYRDALRDYCRKEFIFSSQDIDRYLITSQYALVFLNESAVLRTCYALSLCEHFATLLKLSDHSRKITRLAALLHCIGQRTDFTAVRTPADFERSLKAQYSAARIRSTLELLTGLIEDQLQIVVDQSMQLPAYLFDQKRVSFSLSTTAEVVALSHCIAADKNWQTNTVYLGKQRLLSLLSQKYQDCGVEDSALFALKKHYEQILPAAHKDVERARQAFYRLRQEMRDLNRLLTHYNEKYLA